MNSSQKIRYLSSVMAGVINDSYSSNRRPYTLRKDSVYRLRRIDPLENHGAVTDFWELLATMEQRVLNHKDEKIREAFRSGDVFWSIENESQNRKWAIMALFMAISAPAISVTEDQTKPLGKVLKSSGFGRSGDMYIRRLMEAQGEDLLECVAEMLQYLVVGKKLGRSIRWQDVGALLLAKDAEFEKTRIIKDYHDLISGNWNPRNAA